MDNLYCMYFCRCIFKNDFYAQKALQFAWSAVVDTTPICVCVCVCVKLEPVWNDRSKHFQFQNRLVRYFIASIFLYACESWTLTAQLQRRIQAMEMRCYRKVLLISYKDHVTNEEVRARIQQAIGPHEDHLTIVKRRNLQWYCHVFRS